MEGLKKLLGLLLAVFIVLLGLNQIKQYRTPGQVLNVSATGKATAVPDLATVTFGVSSQGATPDEVRISSTQKMNAATAYLKQTGIDDKDIQTTTLNISPRYQYQAGKNAIVGYQADQAVTVIFRKVNVSKAQLETCLSNATQYGVNNIQGVRFSFSDDESLKNLATKDAIQKAKQNAALLTSEAGLRLGRLINIIQNAGDIQVTPMAYNMAAKMASAPVNNVELGSQEVVSNVTLVYALR